MSTFCAACPTTVVAEVLGISPLDEDVAGMRLVGVRRLACRSLMLTEGSGFDGGTIMLVTGCFFGASWGLTLTSVLSLLTTMGEVCEATLLWCVIKTRGGCV